MEYDRPRLLLLILPPIPSASAIRVGVLALLFHAIVPRVLRTCYEHHNFVKVTWGDISAGLRKLPLGDGHPSNS